MDQLIITMPYIGNALSVNHYLGRGHDGHLYVKPEVKAWKQALQILYNAQIHGRQPKMPVQIHLTAVFKDHRAQTDMNNLHKVIADALQEVIGADDKDFCFHDNVPFIDSRHDAIISIGIELEAQHEILDRT